MTKGLIVYLVILVCIVVSCDTKIPFDKNKWNEKDDIIFKYRNDMVDNIIDSKMLIGKNKNQVHELLGNSGDFGEQDTIDLYEIKTNYDMIDPHYIKYLEIQYNRNMIVNKCKITEYKKGIKTN